MNQGFKEFFKSLNARAKKLQVIAEKLRERKPR